MNLLIKYLPIAFGALVLPLSAFSIDVGSWPSVVYVVNTTVNQDTLNDVTVEKCLYKDKGSICQTKTIATLGYGVKNRQSVSFSKITNSEANKNNTSIVITTNYHNTKDTFQTKCNPSPMKPIYIHIDWSGGKLYAPGYCSNLVHNAGQP